MKSNKQINTDSAQYFLKFGKTMLSDMIFCFTHFVNRMIHCTLYILALAIIFLGFNISSASAQSGMKFEELSKKLEPYFDESLINDVKRQLPQGSEYRIWGWDVGDYSGDGFNDLALSINLEADKKKINHVYLFVDLDGFLTNVAEFTYKYFEMPLEIGVNIRYNTCYITKKIKQFDWVFRGYQFDNGVLVLNNEYTTEKIGKYTHEKTENFSSLRTIDKYIVTNNNDIAFSADYLTIPSYYRSRMVYKGYQTEAFSNYVEYARKGAYWWKGDKDCSFKVSSAYNEKYLYFTVKVNDDAVVDQMCDTCPGDYIEIWFDTSPKARNGQRFVERNGDQLTFRKHPERGIFSFKIYPGDFKTKKAFIKDISTTDKLFDFQKNEIEKIKVVSTIMKGAYEVKFKIPFLFFGFDGPPISKDHLTELGCTVIVHDIDNPFRPEEETQLATSIFNQTDPSTYGALIFIPKDKWYGSSINVYKEDIVKSMNEYGF